jgi:uncharacterized protein (TIGR02996 family)
MSLEDALRAARAQNHREALDRLIGCWRSDRQPRYAELIEQVSGRLVNTEVSPVEGSGPGAFQKAWYEREAHGDPADVGQLTEGMAIGYPSWAGERLAKLIERPADPRIASALLTMIEVPPTPKWIKPSARALWSVVCDGLLRHRDPRTVSRLGAWVAGGSKSFDGSSLQRAVTRRLQEALAVLQAELKTLTELDEEQQALCEQLEQLYRSSAPATGSDLLAAVFADPGDLSIRAVYADWLVAEGDPRGEFITLQLARFEKKKTKPSTREKRLLRTYGQSWLGPSVHLFRHHQFEKGFLYQVAFDERLFASVAKGEAPPEELATVEVVHLSRQHSLEEARLIQHPVFRSLRELHHVDWRALAELARGRPLAVETLGLELWEGGELTVVPSPGCEIALAPETLPELRALQITPFNRGLRPDEARPLFEAPLVQRCAEVTLSWADGPLEGWVELYGGHRGRSLKMRINQFLSFELHATDRGVAVTLHLIQGGYRGDAKDPFVRTSIYDWLENNVGALTAGNVCRVDLADRRWNGAPDKIDSILEALAGLRPEIPPRYVAAEEKPRT